MAPQTSQGLACDVYWGGVSWLRPAHVGLLSAPERSRRDRFRRPEDQERFTLAAVLLRVVVCQRMGTAPAAVDIDRTCGRCGEQHGRPRVVGHALNVSVSHSGEFAAVAVSSAGPTGVDVEQVRPLDHASLWADVFGPAGHGEPRTLAAFYRTWTRKESVLKATGVGLEVPMTEVHVTRSAEPPRLLAYRGEPPLHARMADVSPAEGYAGAVTVLTSEPVVFRESHPRDLLDAAG